ncbi:hypothetical protein [Streptomyces sp. CA-132043]|uniref:hypothetical protein n=1 Tax=Streptomyces sp. CA-132043 TaxID=3240048 RepID=UPI003D8DC17A
MPTDPAAEANEAIRAFMRRRAGRPLWPDERAEYEQLLEALGHSHPQGRRRGSLGRF